VVQVGADRVEQARGQLDLPDDGVAATTEHPPHAATYVAVVDNQDTPVRTTEQAPPTLGIDHRCGFLRSELVLPCEPSALVLRSRRLGVAPPPRSKALVPLGLVGLAVLTVPDAHARPALSSPTTPVRVRRIGLFDLADSTDHVPSIARLHGTVDQPCHADVLIELANREVTA
jgi:hypothetical protein